MEGGEKKFRVLIVGGSVAGLTLAHCLLKNGIGFVVLEANEDIAPPVGASIGILPNGARILDQLGLFDDVFDAVEPLQRSSFWGDSGNLIMSSDTPKILTERHGYSINFLERQTLLQIFYSHLKDGHHKVLLEKRVTKVEHHATHVTASCEDGTSYQGDIIVGADGIRSSVRRQMWGHIDSQGLSKSLESDRNAMTSEYDCVFGISTETPGLVPGESHRTFGRDYSFLTIANKDGHVYWFFFTKMRRRYQSHEIPRFNPAETDKHVAPWLHKPLNGSVCFKDVYEKALNKTHLALEEADFTHWHRDRFVCIGDSIHKMTPNAGQGGNSAIESAVTLANHLTQLLQMNTLPRTDEITKCFQAWEKVRRARVTKIMAAANDLTRLEAGATLKHRIIGLHILPYIKTILLERSSADIVGAPRLKSVPLGPRSLRATMPYLDQMKDTHETSFWQRGMMSLPIWACFGLACVTMKPYIQKVRPLIIPYFLEGQWTAGNEETLDLRGPIYNIGFMDRLFKPLIFCFLPSISETDPISNIQMRTFITDVGTVFGIWMLESYRTCHISTGALLPIVAGTAFQLNGIGKWAPIYYALEYLLVPLQKILPSPQIEAASTISLMMGLLVGAYVPTYMNFTADTVESRRSWNAIWQPFPVIVPALASIIYRVGKAALKTNKRAYPQESPKARSEQNMFWTRAAYISLAAISGITWIKCLHSMPVGSSLKSIFWPSLEGHTQPVASFTDGIARFLQYDQILAMASSFVWLALRFREVKISGASFSWAKATSALIGATFALGPGAAFALGWGWKEELLHGMASL